MRSHRLTGALLTLQLALPPLLAAQRHVGELALSAGFAQAASGPASGGSCAGTASFAFLWGPLGLGPEAGYYHFGGDGHATMLGGVIRLRILRGPTEVYAVGGLADGEFRGPVDINLFSGSAGMGAMRRLRDFPLSVSVEARWHTSLQHSGGAGQPGFVTLQAGGRLRW